MQAKTNENLTQEPRKKGKKNTANIILNKLGVYIIVIILLIAGTIISPEFLTGGNLLNIMRSVALVGIVASGAAFITYSGHFVDMSIPAIMAFSGSITVTALPLGLIPALILGVLGGMSVGLVNGWVVGYLKANPILWTLGVMYFMEGFMRFTWGNNQVYPSTEPGSSGEAFTGLFRINIMSIPIYVIIFFILIITALIVMNKTKFGLYSRLIGSNKESARFTGINVSLTVLMTFLITSFTTSIAGILMTSMNKFGVFYLGEGYEFQTVTAIVIGGVALTGGRGGIMGVLGGVITVGVISNIMTFIGIDTFVQSIVTGTIFISVVAINTYYLRKLGKSHE